MSAAIASSDISHRAVWRIAAPLILSNITVPLLGMVDTAVVGHLSEPYYLGAVAVGATIFSFLFLGLNFLRMGTTGLAAQAAGSGDPLEVRNVLAQALLVAGGLAALLIVFQRPLAWVSLWLIEPDADVTTYARVYFDIRIWAAPATLANYALIGWFIGLGNGRVPLMMALVINLVNIVLDLWLVIGLDMKTAGVAMASVAAEYTGLALGGLAAWRMLKASGAGPDAQAANAGESGAQRLFDPGRLARLFAVNANLFVRTMALMFAFGFFTAMGARQGTVLLAANAVLMNFQYFMASALDGFANAAEALVGRAFGSADRTAQRHAYRLSLIWSVGVAGVFCVLFAVGGRPLIDVLTDLDDVRQAAYAFLPWLIVSPIISCWSFLYDGVYVGYTWTRQMRDTMLFSLLVIYLPAWFVLQPLGNHGLWLAFILFMVSRGATMHVLYLRLGPRSQAARP